MWTEKCAVNHCKMWHFPASRHAETILLEIFPSIAFPLRDTLSTETLKALSPS